MQKHNLNSTDAAILTLFLHFASATEEPCVLIAAGSWLTVNIANIFRIGLSLKLFHHQAQHAWLHEAIGTIVFITFLMGYYQLISRFKYAKANAAG